MSMNSANNSLANPKRGNNQNSTWLAWMAVIILALIAWGGYSYYHNGNSTIGNTMTVPTTSGNQNGTVNTATPMNNNANTHEGNANGNSTN